MDGEDNLGLPQAIGVVVIPVRLGDVGSGPVMAVEDVWLAVGAEEELQRGLAEEVKADLCEASEARTFHL